MTKYAVFDADGFPLGFYADDIHGIKGDPDSLVPDGAIEITEDQWQEFIDNTGQRKWINGAVVAFTPPPVVATGPYQLYKSTLIRRLTEDEASTLFAVLAAAPVKSKMLWDASEWLGSDDPLFGDIKAAISAALGVERSNAILAREPA